MLTETREIQREVFYFIGDWGLFIFSHFLILSEWIIIKYSFNILMLLESFTRVDISFQCWTPTHTPTPNKKTLRVYLTLNKFISSQNVFFVEKRQMSITHWFQHKEDPQTSWVWENLSLLNAFNLIFK